ncbi:hypothetical protein KAU40_00230 [Candidatus Parcubacteria bacterium]|nr:hypothetical protein [Candidatus Parcubacteria bacterium]
MTIGVVIEVVAIVIAIGFVIAGVIVGIQCLLHYRSEKKKAKIVWEE